MNHIEDMGCGGDGYEQAVLGGAFFFFFEDFEIVALNSHI